MKRTFLAWIWLFAGTVSLLGQTKFEETKVIAHRGYWKTENSAQNSIISLYKAQEVGCFGAEFDVHITSDLQLIVFHDDKLEGMKINDTPYEKLRNHVLSNGEILPTLEQYLVHAKNCPDIKLVLEIKPCKAELVAPMVSGILALVDKYKLQPRTEYISFMMDICKELIRLRPGVEIAYLNGDVAPEELKKLGFTGLDYHYSKFEKDLDLANEAHRHGVHVNVWTVNDPVMMKRMVGLGVDYITTDEPELLQQMIKEYAQKYTQLEKPQVDLSTFKKDKNGYITLFDGTSFDGWRGYGRDAVTDKWVLDDGAMKFDSQKSGTGGDIIFSHRFKNYELELEWKIAQNGNSGILYLIQEVPGQSPAASSPEAQVLDNEGHPDAKLGKDGNRKSMSLYDLIPAVPQNAKSYGKWNKAKIRIENGKVTHYQNGKKVVEYTLWTPEWIKMLDNSKFNVNGWTDAYYLMTNAGGVNREGYIGFQDHGDDVWFRNIKVKMLD